MTTRIAGTLSPPSVSELVYIGIRTMCPKKQHYMRYDTIRTATNCLRLLLLLSRGTWNAFSWLPGRTVVFFHFQFEHVLAMTLCSDSSCQMGARRKTGSDFTSKVLWTQIGWNLVGIGVRQMENGRTFFLQG